MASGTDVPFDIPPEVQRQDLTEEARFLVFQFDTVVIPGAPPVLKEPLRIISEAAYQAAEDLSIAPFTTSRHRAGDRRGGRLVRRQLLSSPRIRTGECVVGGCGVTVPDSR